MHTNLFHFEALLFALAAARRGRLELLVVDFHIGGRRSGFGGGGQRELRWWLCRARRFPDGGDCDAGAVDKTAGRCDTIGGVRENKKT